MFELGSADGAEPVVDPLPEAEAQVAALIGVPVRRLSDEDLCARVLRLESIAGRLDAARARAQAELHQRNVTDSDEGMRTGAWIARETRTPPVAARRRVGVSVRLVDEFPALFDALVGGRVSWWHVDAFCRAANERIAHLLAVLIPQLVDLAETMPFGPWCRELRRVAARLDVDGGHDPERDEATNRAHLSRGFDGTRELTARFYGPDGAAVEEMLDTETDRQFRLARNLAKQTDGETEIPSRTELRAMAMMELFRRGTATTGGGGGATAVELTLARHTHTCDHDDESDPVVAARKAVDDLFETTYGDLYAFWQLDTLLCDPIVSVAELELAGLHGHELNLRLGRTRRLADDHQRRAARLRDGGCVFPGCDTPVRWCDCHHVDWWEHGGMTDIENLACLCRYHHGVTHRRGWTMVANGDGTFRWTTPSGRTLHSQQHGIPTNRAGP
jgi:hypothetical protein